MKKLGRRSMAAASARFESNIRRMTRRDPAEGAVPHPDDGEVEVVGRVAALAEETRDSRPVPPLQERRAPIKGSRSLEGAGSKTQTLADLAGASSPRNQHVHNHPRTTT